MSETRAQSGVDIRRRAPLLLLVLSAGLASGSLLVLRASSVLDERALSLWYGLPALLGVLSFSVLAAVVSQRKYRHWESVASRLRHGSRLATQIPLLDAALRERLGSAAEADEPLSPEPESIPDPLMGFRHEFRTPLNAVLGFCDVLLGGIDGEINEAQREDLEIIRSSGLKLRNSLDNALDLSQLGWGELRLEKDRVDANAILLSATSEARQMWVDRPAPKLEVGSKRLVLHADERRLRRVLLSLMDFLASECRDAAIVLELAQKGNVLHIAMRADTSGAMRLESLPTPDEVLASEEADRARLWPVAVASELVSLHGGALYHGSQPPHFLLRLSLAQDE